MKGSLTLLLHPSVSTVSSSGWDWPGRASRVLPRKGPCLPPFPSVGQTPSPAPPTPWWPCTFCNFGLDQPLLSTTCPSLRLVKCPRRNFILETLRSWSLSRALGDDHSLWIRLPAPVVSSQHPEQAMTGGHLSPCEQSSPWTRETEM